MAVSTEQVGKKFQEINKAAETVRDLYPEHNKKERNGALVAAMKTIGEDDRRTLALYANEREGDLLLGAIDALRDLSQQMQGIKGLSESKILGDFIKFVDSLYISAVMDSNTSVGDFDFKMMTDAQRAASRPNPDEYFE